MEEEQGTAEVARGGKAGEPYTPRHHSKKKKRKKEKIPRRPGTASSSTRGPPIPVLRALGGRSAFGPAFGAPFSPRLPDDIRGPPPPALGSSPPGGCKMEGVACKRGDKVRCMVHRTRREGGTIQTMGAVMYVGRLPKWRGVWVGVRVFDQVGDNDGTYKGKRYFPCPEGHGVFVRPGDVELIQMETALHDGFLSTKHKSTKKRRRRKKEETVEDEEKEEEEDEKEEEEEEKEDVEAIRKELEQVKRKLKKSEKAKRKANASLAEMEDTLSDERITHEALLKKMQKEEQEIAAEELAKSEKRVAEANTKKESLQKQVEALEEESKRLRGAAQLVGGHVFVKFCRRGQKHKRTVFLTSTLDAITWSDTRPPLQKEKELVKKKCLMVVDILRAVEGRKTLVFSKAGKAKSSETKRSFSIVGKERTLDLMAESETEAKEWMHLFMTCVLPQITSDKAGAEKVFEGSDSEDEEEGEEVEV